MIRLIQQLPTFEFNAGSTFAQKITLTDRSKNPFPITKNTSAHLRVCLYGDPSVCVIEKICEIEDATQGIINIDLTSADTNELDGKYTYHIILYNANTLSGDTDSLGAVNKNFEGSFIIHPAIVEGGDLEGSEDKYLIIEQYIAEAKEAADNAAESAELAGSANEDISKYAAEAKASAENANSFAQSAESSSEASQSAAKEAMDAIDDARALTDTLQDSINEINEIAEAIEESMARAEAAVDILESSLSDAESAAADATRSAEEAKVYSEMVQQSAVVANSVKGYVSGESVVINDACPLEHVMDVKVSSKNLFDISKVTGRSSSSSGNSVVNNGDGTLTITTTGSFQGAKPNTLRDYAPNLEIGKTYTLSMVTTGSKTLRLVNETIAAPTVITWNIGTPLTITQDILDSTVFWHGDSSTGTATISNIQIEEGTTATEYAPYVDVSTITLNRCGKNLFSNDISLIKPVSFNGTDGTPRNYYGYEIHLPTGKYRLSATTDASLYVYGAVVRNGVIVNSSSVTNRYNGSESYIIAESNNYTPILYTLEGDGNIIYIYDAIGGHTLEQAEEVFSKVSIQLEVGEEVTGFESSKLIQYTPSVDGTVEGVTSLYPTTYLFTDTEGARIDCEYIKVMGIDYGVEGGNQAIKNAIKLSELEERMNDGGTVGDVEGLATEEYVDNAVEGLATEEYVDEKFSSVSGGGTVESTTMNLLAPENLSKWSIVRQSDNPDTPADQSYSHYAGVVDLSNEGIEGIEGALVQVMTNSYTTNWTDFVYSKKIKLGNNCKIKLTPVIKNYASTYTQIWEDSYVDVRFGRFSIRLFRWARDLYGTGGAEDYKNFPLNIDTFNGSSSFYKMRIGLCVDAVDPTTGVSAIDYTAIYSDIVTTSSGPTSDVPTTTLYDGRPGSNTDLGDYESPVMSYIRSICTAKNGHIVTQNEVTNFAPDISWKDITLVLKDGKMQILDASGRALSFKLGIPASDGTIPEEISMGTEIDLNLYMNTYGQESINFDEEVDVRVRCYHDRAVSIYHPLALMRFEIEDYSATETLQEVSDTTSEAAEQSLKNSLRLDRASVDLHEIDDARVIDFDNPNSIINTSSWGVTGNARNMPDLYIAGIRHPVVRHTRINSQGEEVYTWMLVITETAPRCGRQWYCTYPERDVDGAIKPDGEGNPTWSSWRNTESLWLNEMQGYVGVNQGGTGATDAWSARQNLQINKMNLTDFQGTLSIAKGGTGADTVEAARVNLGAAHTFYKEVEVPNTGWMIEESSGAYVQYVQCDEVRATDTPIVDVLTENADPDANINLLEAWSHIETVVCSSDDGYLILFTDGEIPQTSFTMKVKVVR